MRNSFLFHNRAIFLDKGLIFRGSGVGILATFSKRTVGQGGLALPSRLGYSLQKRLEASGWVGRQEHDRAGMARRLLWRGLTVNRTSLLRSVIVGLALVVPASWFVPHGPAPYCSTARMRTSSRGRRVGSLAAGTQAIPGAASRP